MSSLTRAAAGSKLLQQRPLGATILEMSRNASAPDLGGRKGGGADSIIELLYRDFHINSTYWYRYLIYGNYYIEISLRTVPTCASTRILKSHRADMLVGKVVQGTPAPLVVV